MPARSTTPNSERLRKRPPRRLVPAEVTAIALALRQAGVDARTGVQIGRNASIDVAVEPGQLAVFVDHCLLGGCPCRGSDRVPSVTLRDRATNYRRRRDQAVDLARSAGWSTHTVWQHEKVDEVMTSVMSLRRPGSA